MWRLLCDKRWLGLNVIFSLILISVNMKRESLRKACWPVSTTVWWFSCSNAPGSTPLIMARFRQNVWVVGLPAPRLLSLLKDWYINIRPQNTQICRVYRTSEIPGIDEHLDWITWTELEQLDWIIWTGLEQLFWLSWINWTPCISWTGLDQAIN